MFLMHKNLQFWNRVNNGNLENNGLVVVKNYDIKYRWTNTR